MLTYALRARSAPSTLDPRVDRDLTRLERDIAQERLCRFMKPPVENAILPGGVGKLVEAGNDGVQFHRLLRAGRSGVRRCLQQTQCVRERVKAEVERSVSCQGAFGCGQRAAGGRQAGENLRRQRSIRQALACNCDIHEQLTERRVVVAQRYRHVAVRHGEHLRELGESLVGCRRRKQVVGRNARRHRPPRAELRDAVSQDTVDDPQEREGDVGILHQARKGRRENSARIGIDVGGRNRRDADETQGVVVLGVERVDEQAETAAGPGVPADVDTRDPGGRWPTQSTVVWR